LALGAETARAQTPVFVDGAADPSAAGAELAWDVPGGPVVLRTGAGDTPFPAEAIAIGGSQSAVIVGDDVVVALRATGAPYLRFTAPGADALAVSDGWVAVRRHSGAGDRIEAVALGDGSRRTVATAPAPAQLGRPALDGDRLVFHVAGRRTSRIDEVDLASGRRRALRRGHQLRQVTNPSLRGDRLLYVETTPYRQALVL